MRKITELPKKDATQCFTYKVEMIIQVLAKDEETAKNNLDTNGGYVSHREVILLDSVQLKSEK